MSNQGILDFKLTPKQEALLEVLSNPEYARETNERKAELAGVCYKTYYINLRNPNFIQALRIRGLSENIALTLPVLRRIHKDALNGKWMQQDATMRMAGLITQQAPLINVILNQSQAPLTDIDRSIIDKIIDIQPIAITKDNDK
jgi:hypothetical protein